MIWKRKLGKGKPKRKSGTNCDKRRKIENNKTERERKKIIKKRDRTGRKYQHSRKFKKDKKEKRKYKKTK